MEEPASSGRGVEATSRTQPRYVLAVDVGNSETHFGLFRGRDLVGTRTLTTHRRLTSDEALMQADDVLASLDPEAEAHGAVLSCVVPALTDAWAQALRELAATRPLVVGPGIRTGVRMRYHDPSEVGPDRIADIVAAREAHGAPVVVVDLGTTTNIEVIDQAGTFLGGIIAPGLRLGARALSDAAARLPMIELRAPERVIGRSTREAMQSGVVLGEVARIDGLLDAVMGELGQQVPVVLTGTGAREMQTLIRHEAEVDETLTLRGLELVWEGNRR